MTLPLYTTTVGVERPDDAEERWADSRAYSAVASSWPAVLGNPTAQDRTSAQSSDQVVDAVLWLDQGRAVARLDRVTDVSTGTVYEVQAIVPRTGLDLDHQRSLLRTIGVR